MGNQRDTFGWKADTHRTGNKWVNQKDKTTATARLLSTQNYIKTS